MGFRDFDPRTTLPAFAGGAERASERASQVVDIPIGMPIIYRKTAKGVSEIETRAHRLPPRLRGALIVVDGKRSDVELAAMLPQATEVLQALAEQGFIEAAAQVAAPPPRPVAPTPAAPAPAAAGAGASPADFEARRRKLLRLFNDLVGPAGEGLAMKIEKTRSLDELRALLPQAVNLVGMVRGRGEAQTFADQLDQL